MDSLSDYVVIAAGVCWTVSVFRKWLRRAPVNPAEKECAEVLDVLDDCDLTVEEAVVPFIGGRSVPKPKRKRCRQNLAATVAMTAYLKFGARGKTEANVIITRKFISDLLAAREDMRLRDKIEIMDLAVFLSFVPTKTKLQCEAMYETEAYTERELGGWAMP